MKNFIYTLVILLALFSLKINAQVSVGIMGGLNISDLKTDLNLIESVSKIGIGGFIEYNFTENFSIVAEPMYLEKGGLQPESDVDPEIKINLSYFELPLLLKYSFNIGDSFKPYLLAGPTAGYRLSADMSANISMTAFSADLKNASKDFDWGVTFGAGLEIPLEEIYLIIEGRYSLGLMDIHKNGTFEATGGGNTIQTEFDDDDWFKTRGIQIMAGLKFPLGK